MKMPTSGRAPQGAGHLSAKLVKLVGKPSETELIDFTPRGYTGSTPARRMWCVCAFVCSY